MGEFLIEEWRLGERELSVATLREKFSAKEKFRVSPRRFQAGEKCSGSTREGAVYVLEGSCSFKFGEHTYVLSMNQVFHHAAGSFEFEVLGVEACEYVHVWDIEMIQGQIG